MELESKYTVAGLFVLLVSILALVSLLWVSDLGSDNESDRYVVIFSDHSLDGLQNDSEVTMKGIKVGSIDSYSIDGKNIEAVRAVLRINKDIPVKIDTKAVVRRNILTGLAWVELIGGTQEAVELGKKKGEEYPIIAEGKSGIDKLAASLPDFIDQANETMGHVRMIFSEDNATRLSAVIQNVSEITERLNSRGEQFDSILTSLDTTLNKVAKASEHFENVASGLDTGVEEIRSELHTTLQQFNRESVSSLQSVRSSADLVSQEFVLMSQSVSDASQAIARTMEGFEQPREILTGPTKKSFGPGE